MAAGDAQFGVSFQDTMASYVSGDAAMPVTAIAAIIQHNTSGIISMKDKGITSPAKMMDHTYATWEMPISRALSSVASRRTEATIAAYRWFPLPD